MTLGVACGTSDQWSPVESAWKTVLDNHNAPPLHTTDAIGLHKDFSRKNGWDDEKVDGLISNLVTVIEQNMVIPGRLLIPDPQFNWVPRIAKGGLNIFTFTIPLDDYQRARQAIPLLSERCADTLVSECLGIVARWGRRLGAERYELYFDRGEPFLGHAYDRWVNKKSKKQIAFMQKVAHCGPTNANVCPALQIADLFAWCANHIQDVRRGWHRRLNHLSWDSLILDYKHLLNPIPGALERTAAWNLRPTKMDKLSKPQI